MKKLIVIAIFPWLTALFGQKALAQTEINSTTVTTTKDGKKETQEIVIRKNGEKDVNLQIQITGGSVIVNGKPLVEFKDDQVSIKNKNIIIRGDSFNFKDFNFDEFANMGRVVQGFRMGDSKAILGVFTEPVENGVKITSLNKNGAAEKAGLQVDDVITKVNKTAIGTTESLSNIISSFKPNDEVTVYYKRGKSKEKSVKATLQKRESSDVRNMTITAPNGNFKSFSFPTPPTPPTPPTYDDFYNFRGFNGNNGSITITAKQNLGIKVQDTEEENGVTILEVNENSPAATAGILKNDVLIEFNNQPVKNTDDARKLMRDNANLNAYPVKVKRAGKEMVLNVKIPKKLKTTNL